jgi:uncharacterized protein (TIGR03437 family)
MTRTTRHCTPNTRCLLLALTLVMTLVMATAARAALQLRTVATGLVSPVLAIGAGDGSGRLFIVEQAGRIRVLANGALLPAAFLDIRARVRSGGEMGLLGLAFHPRFAENGRLFVNYTRTSAAGLETVIAEFSVPAASPNSADVASERTLLTYGQPFDNHNGGMIAFGPDGYLYIASGDGGAGGDPQGHGQNLTSLLGKMLRIDVDRELPYAIPETNPFVGVPGLDEIFAYGLRNPWRFSFDRLTGRLFAGDVGQDMLEEIDIIVRGGNYGWNRMEGSACYSPRANCNRDGLVLPIYDYGRTAGASVTGGYVYRGAAIPWLQGKYVYGDFVTGRIWALSELSTGAWRNEELLDTPFNVSSFGEDDSGELYVLDYSGSLRQLSSDGREPRLFTQGIVNAASFVYSPVAPGEIVSLFGANMGPATAVGATLDAQGRIAREAAGTRVWFDEITAPLFYTQAGQINAQVPYGIAGHQQVMVQVQTGGTLSNVTLVPVAAAAPGLFALSGGRGPGAILNSDLALNSAARPAARGSEVVLYATGEGLTTPAAAEGQLAAPPLPVPQLPVSVRIGGVIATVRFAGLAPGFAGLLQINVVVPANTATGPAVPVELQVGPNHAPTGITLAIN